MCCSATGSHASLRPCLKHAALEAQQPVCLARGQQVFFQIKLTCLYRSFCHALQPACDVMKCSTGCLSVHCSFIYFQQSACQIMLLACEDILEALVRPQMHSRVYPCHALQQKYLCLHHLLFTVFVICMDSANNADNAKLHPGIIRTFGVRWITHILDPCGHPANICVQCVSQMLRRSPCI